MSAWQAEPESCGWHWVKGQRYPMFITQGEDGEWLSMITGFALNGRVVIRLAEPPTDLIEETVHYDA